MSADDFPRSLSASRIGDFSTCPLLYRYRTIDRIPEAPAPAAIMGTLMHSALEDLFDLPAVERTPHAAHELFEAAWVDLQESDVEASAAVIDRIGSAPDLIASYFAIEDPVRLEPHAREFGLETPITPKFNIRGFVDRIDKAPDGRIRIVDYKTGKAPRPQYQDKPMFQMRFYALAWWRIHDVVPAMLQLLFLGNREILRYEPTKADLLSTEQRVLKVRDAISQSADSGVFTPTPSKLCHWCDHQAICPAKGGTPPPIPPRDLWLEKSPITRR